MTADGGGRAIPALRVLVDAVDLGTHFTQFALVELQNCTPGAISMPILTASTRAMAGVDRTIR